MNYLIHFSEAVTPTSHPKYQAYTLKQLRKIPQLKDFTEEQLFAMEVVAHVLPFRTNNYVIEELINWDNVPDDPIFILTFPQKDMLTPSHFKQMAEAIRTQDKTHIKMTANAIRTQLNPHPAGQMEHNLPQIEGKPLSGMQHKYEQTVLFFPSQGQTCHAYCSFCFRWPQFVGMNELKIAMKEVDLLIKYLQKNPQITDVIFTGGDPLIMKTASLAAYIDALLDADLPHLQNIRIGTKALAYWPYRFLTDNDAKELLQLFKRVNQAGKHLAFMAHFNHPIELETKAVQQAIQQVLRTGAQIRTQSPVLSHINDDADIWAKMWKKQVNLGCIPYYFFLVRDTGAQHYFGVNLAKAWEIFQGAYQQVGGIARTVRGPSMSASPGKVQVLGVQEVQGEKVFVLQFLQGRQSDWVLRPFFAHYDEQAAWLDDLKPAFNAQHFFFEY